MANPKPAEVRAQLERICSYGKFRGRKAEQLLAFLVKECVARRGSKLRLQYIAEALKDEPLTFEKDTQQWGYPKTRANLAHVRKRLREYYETKGYYDPVIIKLNPGSYAPVIAYNPASTGIPSLEPSVERLILRAKTALDARTLRGAWRALRYYLQIPFNIENPRQTANILFIPMASAAIIPSAAAAVRADAEVTIAHVRALGVEPWECTFADACCEACYQHNWRKSLDLFELAIANSQGEATYYWWYTALLASQGRIEQAIHILDSAVRHFSRTNIATRTDLGLLQIMAGRFAEAEETLSASLDFTAADNPLIAYSFAILYEAQDRLKDAGVSMMKVLRPENHGGPEAISVDEALQRRDWHVLLNGMLALVAGRSGAIGSASEMLDILLACKATRDRASSVEIALAFIGVGKLDDAVAWLSKAALEEDDSLALWFHIFPPLRHLHRHRGFRDLLAKLNLRLKP